MGDVRSFEPKSLTRHRQVVEFALVLFLAVVLGYAYLEKYWIPTAPLYPGCPTAAELVFAEDSMAGIYINTTLAEAFTYGISIEGLSYNDTQNMEIVIDIGENWDCGCVLDGSGILVDLYSGQPDFTGEITEK